MVFYLPTVFLLLLGQGCGHQQGRCIRCTLCTQICIISPTVDEDLKFISMIFTFMFSVLCNLHIPRYSVSLSSTWSLFFCILFSATCLHALFSATCIYAVKWSSKTSTEMVLKKKIILCFWFQDQELGVGGFRLQLLARTGRPLQWHQHGQHTDRRQLEPHYSKPMLLVKGRPFSLTLSARPPPPRVTILYVLIL